MAGDLNKIEEARSHFFSFFESPAAYNIQGEEKVKMEKDGTQQSVMTSSCRVIEYSSKSIVVTGETKPLKDELRELGGRFNPHLETGPGWVFKVEDRAKVEAFLKDPQSNSVGNPASSTATNVSSSSSSSSKRTSVEETGVAKADVPYIVQYSEKSIAVFGDSRAVKDKFKEINGRFNKHLKYECKNYVGWVFPDKSKFKVQEILTDYYGVNNVPPISDLILAEEEKKDFQLKDDTGKDDDNYVGTKRQNPFSDDDDMDDFLTTSVTGKLQNVASKEKSSPTISTSTGSLSAIKDMKKIEAEANSHDKQAFLEAYRRKQDE